MDIYYRYKTMLVVSIVSYVIIMLFIGNQNVFYNLDLLKHLSILKCDMS